MVIHGPEGTPYEGGKFVTSVDFSDNYPFKCPQVRFITKIYHPNVKTDTGEICAQALQNTWVPTLNADYVIKMLKELITHPNPQDPQEADIAGELMT